jgi:2-oxoglutarate dehydrogenase E2 component (dihydrolipoamide succinyltransferase)
MSKLEIHSPQLSESVTEATLLTWHKQVGEAVVEGENLVDVETDKVVLELPAPASGVLKEILKGEGEKVGSEEVVAVMAVGGVVANVTAKPLSSPATSAPSPVHGGRLGWGEDSASSQKSSPHPPTKSTSGAGSNPPPQAGEGAGMAGKGAGMAADERPSHRTPMTRIRQRIAERLLQSQHNAAILTTFNEVNRKPVMDLRNEHKTAVEKKHGVKLGFSSFFVKAAVAALQKFPIVNASIDGADIVHHNYYDIGVAIGSERGLLVPVIRDADQLSFADIEKRIADFAARAKEGKLALEELEGGTFSISNGGVFGSLLSTPIINPPQSAILGIHATKDRPIAENGQVVIRPMNYVALSYDHRLIDGREAVLFLVAIKEALESPTLESLDL